MRRIIVLLAVVALTVTALARPASADPVRPPVERPPTGDRPKPPVERPPNEGRGRPALEIKNHDPFKVDGAISGATITTGPYYDDGSQHGDWLSLDYQNGTGAVTLYWSNNKGLSGSATQLGGTYPLWTVTDAGCPLSSTNFSQFSHNEYAVLITATWTDNLGSPWTVYNEYWHMGTISTGTKANGASFGTQATHPTGGCKYYNLPSSPSDHGRLASTGAHIHHEGTNASTYQSSPIQYVWSMPSH